MSEQGDKRVFTVTSDGKPACVKSLLLYSERDQKRSIWVLHRRDGASEETCRNAFTLGEAPSVGYETAVALAQPLRPGEYRMVAMGVGWQASKQWTVLP